MSGFSEEISSVKSLWTVDQVNGGWVKLSSCDQDDLNIELPASLLPSTVNEGQVFQMDLAYDPSITQNEQSKVAQKITELSDADDGEDFSL